MKVSMNARIHIGQMVEAKFESIPKEPVVEEYERCNEIVKKEEASLQKYVDEHLKKLQEKFPRMKVSGNLYLRMEKSPLSQEYYEACTRRSSKITKVADEVAFQLEMGGKASELENIINNTIEKA